MNKPESNFIAGSRLLREVNWLEVADSLNRKSKAFVEHANKNVQAGNDSDGNIHYTAAPIIDAEQCPRVGAGHILD